MPLIEESDFRSDSNCAVMEKRTRRRKIRCCENCRSSKSKCSKHPEGCMRCVENRLQCVYLPQDDEGWEMIEKRKEEHQRIDHRIPKRARVEEDLDDESDGKSDIEPSPLIATDAAYEDDDDFEDNGIRVGRFNLTKRIGSDYRPKIMHELQQMLDKNDLFRTDHDRQVFNSLPKPHWLNTAAGPEVLDPDPHYIAPSLFSHTLQVNEHMYKVPCSQDLADKIMAHYWECVHPVACIVYRPSFQERYNVFWYNAFKNASDTPESTQALIYAALFAGIVSMDAETIKEELEGEKEEWMKTFENATAIYLSHAHVIRTQKPETIQAFVMYLIPMCRGIISRTLATLVASAIDLARGMGLNKDGTYYGFDPVITQVHRLIWHQLCFLDIRVSEAQSPRPRIRKDDFNTKFPLNVDDSELKTSDFRKDRRGKWTGMTLSNARMECNEKIREIFAARQRARQGSKSNSAYIKKMLEMIWEFQQYMAKKYYPMIDDKVPIQHYTRLVIDLHCSRMHAMVLHEYHMSTPRGRMPEQWIHTVIKSGLETMEIAREIETSDILRRWRWYAEALQQHSYAALMVIEVFAFPMMAYVPRAWKLLDWIFQVPPCIPHAHKGRWVLEGALGVMKEYLKARKLRCPILMDERLDLVPQKPLTPILPSLRGIAVTLTETDTTAQCKCKGTSFADQTRASPHGTICENHLGMFANATLSDRALSEMPATSSMRASPQDMAMTSGAQAGLMDGLTYEEPKQICTNREEGFVTSAPHSAQLDRASSEDDTHMLTRPDNVSDESMDTTSSWESVVDSDSPVEHSGYGTGDDVARSSDYLGSPGSGHYQGDVGDIPSASSSETHSPHHGWNIYTASLPNPPYVPAGNGVWQAIGSHGHSRSNSHNNSQIIDEGSYMHFPDYSSSFFPVDPSGFTPINQSTQTYAPPYTENFQPVEFPTLPSQPKEFRNVGPSDFEEPMNSRKR